jgi:uncharacterized protein YbjT (DUF2867 family)
MKVLVFGATGGSGRAIVSRLLDAGHDVTAFVRDPGAMDAADGLTIARGDATEPEDVAPVVPGHDAIVISLGQRPEPFEWLPGRRRSVPARVCEAGTRAIVDAVPAGAAPRLVVVSAFGVGDTRDTAPWYIRLYLRLFMGELMADKERQEALLKATDLDYVLVQPVALTDGPATGTWLADPAGRIRKSQVSRADLAAFIVTELGQHRHRRETVAFSG